MIEKRFVLKRRPSPAEQSAIEDELFRLREQYASDVQQIVAEVTPKFVVYHGHVSIFYPSDTEVLLTALATHFTNSITAVLKRYELQ